MSTPDPARLACGHDLAPLVAHVADGTHSPRSLEEGCPDCRATLATLAELWEVVGVLAARKVTSPDTIGEAVLRSIRRELFLAEVSRIFGGLLPRLGRALLVYSGLRAQRRRA